MPDADLIVEDHETLYRRIVCQPTYYDPGSGSKPSPQAFSPTSRDLTGLSLFRAKYLSPQQIVSDPQRNPGRRPFFIASLLAADLIHAGIHLRVNNPQDPAHVELPDICYDTRKDSLVLTQIHDLANILCRSVEGPFQP